MRDQDGKLLTGVCRVEFDDITAVIEVNNGKQTGMDIYSDGKFISHWPIGEDGDVKFIKRYYDEKGQEISEESVTKIDNITYYNNKLFTGTLYQYYPDGKTLYTEALIAEGKYPMKAKMYWLDGTLWLEFDSEKNELDRLKVIKKFNTERPFNLMDLP